MIYRGRIKAQRFPNLTFFFVTRLVSEIPTNKYNETDFVCIERRLIDDLLSRSPLNILSRNLDYSFDLLSIYPRWYIIFVNSIKTFCNTYHLPYKLIHISYLYLNSTHSRVDCRWCKRSKRIIVNAMRCNIY